MMASNATGKVHAFPTVPPMPAVARILSRYDRKQLEAFLSVAIDLLDTLDGDENVEDSDVSEDDDPREEDDPPGQCDEDEINTGSGIAYRRDPMSNGPGCPLSDCGV